MSVLILLTNIHIKVRIFSSLAPMALLYFLSSSFHENFDLIKSLPSFFQFLFSIAMLNLSLSRSTLKYLLDLIVFKINWVELINSFATQIISLYHLNSTSIIPFYQLIVLSLLYLFFGAEASWWKSYYLKIKMDLNYLIISNLFQYSLIALFACSQLICRGVMKFYKPLNSKYFLHIFILGD